MPPIVESKPQTTYDRYVSRLKSHPIFAAIIIVAAVVAGLAQFTEGITKLGVTFGVLGEKQVVLPPIPGAIYKDDYGVHVFDKWFAERDYFIKNVLSRDCPSALPYLDQEWIRDSVDAVALSGEDSEALVRLPSEMSPLEFEIYCANLLESSVWETQLTTATGDQGVDIIAVKGGIRAVFQCKLYSGSVGNAAVQEILAGKQFQRAHLAGVITNSTYTASARQLAAVSEVHLLHFSEVGGFLHKLAVS